MPNARGGASGKRMVITIDPSLQYARELHYREKHSGWQIYKAVYWSIYIFVVGLMLATLVPVPMSLNQFIGFALVILALFTIVYGFSESLHLKLMKRYA
ncbi:MAG: hypothetical protein KGH98_00605 [Candidatus Micrarchaeota archaeon]|nr:hypothetical protein [Candidatus Micrarchaeota archaeon]